MLSRRVFLAALSAGAACAAHGTARAANAAYRTDGEYDYPAFGILRSTTFFADADRPDVQIVAASLLQKAAKADIVAGSQLEIRGSQLWHVADENHATIGINGGCFEGASFSYDGLLRIDGRQLSPKNSQFDGAVTVDAGGLVSLKRVTEAGEANSALQAGPFFIEPGGKMGMKAHTYDRFRRSFIAQASDVVVAGITSPVSLYQLAQLLLQYPQAFQVDRFDSALNMCGAATAAFFAQTGKNTFRDGGAWNSPALILFWPR